jgi:CheY-like chemotaxis protein/anti-sigma regulatory factor (Ser/Thr protein kinase)
MSREPDQPAPVRSPPEADEPGTPVKLLVVDDGVVDRRLAGAIVERTLGWKVVYAENGRDALAVIEAESPRVILTDLNMPEMDGLQLVAAVRKRWPLVPVVLMTAFGNEEIALKALRAGAASYVPKKSLSNDLASTLEQVLTAAQGEVRHRRALGSLGKAELHFTLENDRSLIAPLVAHLQQYLDHLGLCDHTSRTRVGVALEEALLNAMFHGNLEVSSELRQQGEEPYYRLADQRRKQAPYRDRQVNCIASVSRAEVVCSVKDEGPGFDPSKLPDPTDPANLERVGGRGLLLIRTFMDDVTFNSGGNQITMVKKREPAKT